MKQFVFLVLFLLLLPFCAKLSFAQGEVDTRTKLNFLFTSSRSGKQEIWKKENGVYTQLTKEKNKKVGEPEYPLTAKRCCFIDLHPEVLVIQQKRPPCG